MNHPDRGHKPTAEPPLTSAPPPPPAASLDAHTRAVLRAAEDLTTEVRRIADALTTPADALTTPAVAHEVADDDTPTTPGDGCTSACQGVTGIRGLLEHVGIDTTGQDITVAGRVVDQAPAAAPRIERFVPLATTCGHCGHPYNWHASRGACEFGNDEVRCGCDTFTVGQRPEPIDPWRILGAEAPAERCDHRGPHPGFTCAEVDATQPYFRVRWEQEQPALAVDEDAQRAARRTALRNLLDRAARGVPVSPGEGDLLRQHAEAEIREADTARSVAAGNKRHVQVMYEELQQAEEAARRALEQRQEMAEERYAWQERGDRSERAAEAADRVRAEVQRDRDQHAAVLKEVLATFVHKVSGYRLPRVRSGEVDVVTLDKWRSVVAPTVERPWWVDVAEIRAELEEAQAVIERVRSGYRLCGDCRINVVDLIEGPTSVAADPPACDAYQPPTTATDSGLCASCGMHDWKHQPTPTTAAASAPVTRLRKDLVAVLADYPVAAWTPSNIAGRVLRVMQPELDRLSATEAAIARARERCQGVRDRIGPGGMINATQILDLLSPTWPDGNYEAPAPGASPDGSTA